MKHKQLFAIIQCVFILSLFSCSSDKTTVSATETPSVPTETATALLPTTTPTPGIGSIITGEDGSILVYVPAGEFNMGGTDELVTRLKETSIPWLKLEAPDSEPAHVVYLDAYWIDQTEVTIEQYQECVAAGVCTEPTIPGNYNANQF